MTQPGYTPPIVRTVITLLGVLLDITDPDTATTAFIIGPSMLYEQTDRAGVTSASTDPRVISGAGVPLIPGRYFTTKAGATVATEGTTGLGTIPESGKTVTSVIQSLFSTLMV